MPKLEVTRTLRLTQSDLSEMLMEFCNSTYPDLTIHSIDFRTKNHGYPTGGDPRDAKDPIIKFDQVVIVLVDK